MHPRVLPILAAALGLSFAAAPSSRPSSDGHTTRDRARPDSLPPSNAWLSLLPDGETKRRFVLDCTGCHQLHEGIAFTGGRARTSEEWHAAVQRMLGYAGAQTGFPVISAAREPAATAEWLAMHLRAAPTAPHAAPASTVGRATITEFPLPVPRDLPHDVAIDSGGRVLITGMFTDRMLVLDGATGALDTVPIPVARANPRAVELDSRGRWWVVLGAPGKLARYEPARREWRTFDVGFYAHSVAVDRDGRAWANGHFTRDPAVLASVDTGGQVQRVSLPRHPSLADVPGGPIPYEVRIAPDGRVWTSELHGNRLTWHDPATGASGAITMPVEHSGPRRFDIDSRGDLWIPAYADNELVRYAPATQRFERFALPVRDAAPYVVRVDAAGDRLWIGTGAADAVLAFDIRTRRFTVYPLPSRGAMVRHLAVDPRTREVWLAYGASPGIAARVARLTPGK